MQNNLNEGFNEEDLEQTIEQPEQFIEPIEDENAVRYGLSFLINVPLYKHLGNNVMIDVNKRDATTKEVTVNTKYFPRLMLIPFKSLTAAIPAENRASRTSSGSYEANSGTFNPEVAESQDTMLRGVRKSATKCAELFVNTYGKDGGMLFNGLTGIDEYSEAKAILMAVCPLNDQNIFPRITRNILGEEFIAPFLDQILNYLQSNAARERINKIARTEEQESRLLAIYNEVLTGARNANTIAKSQIATTEQQISASPQQKSGYDIRDPQFRDSPEPFDLVCLAHRNEIPKSERQLAQAQKMQETNNAPLAEVSRSLGEVAKLMIEAQKTAQPVGASGMSAAEIAELINSRVAAATDEIRSQLRAEAATPGAEIPTDDQSPETSVTAKTAKAAKGSEK